MSAIPRPWLTLAARPLVSRLSTEWRDSRLLRLGAIAIGGIVWLYAILLLSDARGPARERLALLEDRVATARAEEHDQGWPAREAAATHQLAALRSVLWKAATRSLAEAAFRDWIQQTAQASNLKVKSIAVQTADTRGPAGPLAGANAGAALPADVSEVRARMAVDFDRQAWAAFLYKLSGSARIVNVDRFLVHLGSGQTAAEIDLVALFSLEAPGA